MMKNRNSLTVIQLNDSHAYFDLHQEMFWLGGQAVYRSAGGYTRIAALIKQIRAVNKERVLFCDCGDTLQGTHAAQSTQGQTLIPVINSLGLDAMTAHWEFAYGPATFKQRVAELIYPMLAINVFCQATQERLFPPYNVKESVPVQRSAYWRHKLVLRAVLLVAVYSLLTLAAMAQEPVGNAGEPQKLTAPAKEELSSARAKVEVSPVARDEEIVKRLQNILHATNWFTDPQVRVEEGVVFLYGQVESEELKKWAGDLARNTQDVVAVANRMEVLEPPVWDFRRASSGLLILWRDFIHSLPFIVLGLLILALSAGAGLLATVGVRTFLHRRIRTKLLQNVIARGAGGLVFLCGAYIILRVSGLTQLALTVVGGTGLIGLVIGIAFREITENFLASIFLSVQRPFETGDLVEVSGETGYVQQLNMRTTILMTLDGNLVQIPNAVVYKSNLRNFTTTSNRREDFVVGIGYDDAIDEAQEVARKVLADHPAVLTDPEPSVLADSLGMSTVNLRVYFWLNGREHSWLKVRSSVIRLVKRAFQKHGISMPDEAREVVFPQGVPVTVLDGKPADARGAMPGKRLPPQSQPEELDAVSTKAEAGLYSEAVVIEEQARQAQPLKDGENLLPVASSTAASEKKMKEPKP